ncbi:MAG: regulatory protein RecX [Alphaproteobacteria bacterium]|nr:regulatory protein RecX [Alphaproteobacteria bacterium]
MVQSFSTPPTPESLGKAALQYLERYACSEAGLRNVLENRIRRATIKNRDFASDQTAHEALKAAIDQIVLKYKKLGVLNDKAFAEAKVNSLRREGRSRRAIQQKLAAKGISASFIKIAINRHAEDQSSEEAELAAACVLAKRRKLGPFRKTSADKDRRRKDLAVLARAGFPLDIACRALKTTLSEEEEDAAQT